MSFHYDSLTEASSSFTSIGLSFGKVLSDAAQYASFAPPELQPISLDEGKVSWTKAGFLIANLIVGGGIFTTPSGLKLFGWLGIASAIAASVAGLWTALLLGDLLHAVSGTDGLLEQADKAPPSYNTIGERAFGAAFVPFFGVFAIGQCLLQGVYMITVSAQSWHVFLEKYLHINSMIFVNAAACLLVTLTPRRYFGIIAKVGVALTISAMGVVVASGLSLRPDHTDHQQTLTGENQLIGSLAAVILSCGDHVCFPDIYNATGRCKKTYKKGAIMGFGIFLTCTLAFCIPCYLTMGVSIKSNVLTNIGVYPNGDIMPVSEFPDWLRGVTNGVLAFRFLFIIPCFMPCIFAALDGVAGLVTGQDFARAQNVETVLVFLREEKATFVICLLNRIIGYVGLALLSVFFQQFLQELITIVGSLFQSVNVIVIPCLAYFKLCSYELNGRPIKRALLYLMLLFGSAWCIVGTVSGILGIIHHTGDR